MNTFDFLQDSCEVHRNLRNVILYASQEHARSYSWFYCDCVFDAVVMVCVGYIQHGIQRLYLVSNTLHFLHSDCQIHSANRRNIWSYTSQFHVANRTFLFFFLFLSFSFFLFFGFERVTPYGVWLWIAMFSIDLLVYTLNYLNTPYTRLVLAVLHLYTHHTIIHFKSTLITLNTIIKYIENE